MPDVSPAFAMKFVVAKVRIYSVEKFGHGKEILLNQTPNAVRYASDSARFLCSPPRIVVINSAGSRPNSRANFRLDS